MENIAITQTDLQNCKARTKWKELSDGSLMISVLQPFEFFERGLPRTFSFSEQKNIQLDLSWTMISRNQIIIKPMIKNKSLNTISALIYDSDKKYVYQIVRLITFYDNDEGTITLWDNEGYLRNISTCILVFYANISERKKTLARKDFEAIFLQKQLNDYRKILNNAELSDLTLMVSGEKLFVHKAVLAAKSPVFYEILIENRNLKEIEILDANVESIKILLQFIYTSEMSTELDVESAMEIILVSRKYSINGLTQKLAKIITEQLNQVNVIGVLIFAHDLHLKQLKEEGINFFVKNLKFFKLDQLRLKLEKIGNLKLYSELLMSLVEDINNKTDDALSNA